MPSFYLWTGGKADKTIYFKGLFKNYVTIFKKRGNLY